MSNSLVSVGHLIEADYGVIFRIPSNADSDGFPSAQFLLYGGSVTTPDGSTVIVMEFVNHTWKVGNSFSSLLEDFDSSTETYVPTFLSNERVEGRLQQRFENLCRLRKETVNLHRAHGRTSFLNLEAHSILHKHLKRYILAVP